TPSVTCRRSPPGIHSVCPRGVATPRGHEAIPARRIRLVGSVGGENPRLVFTPRLPRRPPAVTRGGQPGDIVSPCVAPERPARYVSRPRSRGQRAAVARGRSRAREVRGVSVEVRPTLAAREARDSGLR